MFLFYCVALPACGQAGGAQSDAPVVLPQVRVEYFGAERGFAVGTQTVKMLCVVRNIGTLPIAADTLRLRCYTLAGLDYTTGELWPALPAMAPGQALLYRWNLVPSAHSGPLIVAALLTGNTASSLTTHGPGPAAQKAEAFAPLATISVIPRLESEPKRDAPNSETPKPKGVSPASQLTASANEDTAWIGNERVGIRIIASENREPLLFLGGRNGADWKTLAVIVPLFSVLSGEEGQIPWRQTFHWDDAQAASDKTKAELTLRGTLGTQWLGKVVLKAQSGTAAIQGILRLTARRAMRLHDLRLPQLLARDTEKTMPGQANGTAITLTDAPEVLPETARISAEKNGMFVFGIAWSQNFAYANWQAAKTPANPLTDFPLLGVVWHGSERGTLVQPGETLEVPFRLFAFAPSETLRDALRFLMN